MFDFIVGCLSVVTTFKMSHLDIQLLRESGGNHERERERERERDLKENKKTHTHTLTPPTHTEKERT